MGYLPMVKIVALIPCYNEELTVGKVIDDFRKFLPSENIYVFDNNSSDKTIEIASNAGVNVEREWRQGKGYVMQAMFNKIDADIYVMVDGDDTYDLDELPGMLNLVREGKADAVVGNRLKKFTDKSFRLFHTFGNRLVKGLINTLFEAKMKDIMSGFRVMNKQFVKNINIMSPGFEVETEMTIKALKYGFLVKEVDINYRERPEGSVSKLHTFRDGFRVIKTIFSIFKNYKPLLFFSYLSLILFITSCVTGFMVTGEFMRIHYIMHVTLAIFSSVTMILSIVLFVTGIILDVVGRRFDEILNLLKNKNVFGEHV